MTDSERAMDWLQRDANRRVNLAMDRGDGVIPGMWGDFDSIASLAALLEQVRAEENKACTALVETERDKLGGRWSLDSAYLHQAIDAIRARSESKETPA